MSVAEEQLVASSSARVLSVNLGQPTEIAAGNRNVLSSIFKEPTTARVRVHRETLEGDRVSDLRVHGGPYKAVYAYPSEHYAYWAQQLADAALPFGVFGENLTTLGLTEENVAIGERFRVGSAVLEVSQPRMPCFKLALRFGRSDMVKRFWTSGYSGFYFAVAEEGELGVGDRIERLTSSERERITVAQVVGLFKGDIEDPELLERALQSRLRGSWKKDIRERWANSALPLF